MAESAQPDEDPDGADGTDPQPNGRLRVTPGAVQWVIQIYGLVVAPTVCIFADLHIK